jgi:hypothetical protein
MSGGRIYRVAMIKLVAALTYGCVHTHPHVSAPSSAEVSGHVGTAASANTQAQRYNDVARVISGRIDAKAGVLERYWPKDQ